MRKISTMLTGRKAVLISIPFLFALLISLFVILSAKILPPKLPLFYSLPWGENQLASREQLLIIPAIISLIALTNLALSWQLHPYLKWYYCRHRLLPVSYC